jgi:signal transduction histidine kinase
VRVGVRWRLRRWAAVLIVVEAVMLAASIALGVIGLKQLGDARSRVVDQIDPQLLQAQNLTAALLNQETGLRGFQLSGQQTFLTPYDEGLRQQDQAVAELRALGAVEGTDAGRDLANVLVQAGEWQRAATRMLTGPTPVDPALVDLTKAEFDNVRSSLDIQHTDLSQARAADRDRLRQAANLLGIMLGAVVVLLVALFVVLALGFQRKFARPVMRLAGEVRRTTDDIERRIPAGDGPRELVELADDVEAMRQRLVDEVAELRRAHATLDVRTRELQRSNSDLEQFAYVASHDLQEPLRKVTSFCQLIQRRYQGQLDERGEQYIEFAVDGARRMQVLINDLLAFSRVGRKSGEFVLVDMGTVLAAAMANLATAVEESGAQVEHDALPAVRGEATLLTVLLQNLLSNAIKFRGDAPPRISFSATRSPGEWTFAMADNGIGIEAEYADRIFVIFQRLHARSAYPGTGIGLAMAKKIVEYHGGRIWLDTTAAGSGTTFKFTLPDQSEET